MFNNPIVIGIKQSKSWNGTGSAKTTLYELGMNTGNMMFTQALLTVLDNAKWGSFGLSEAELEGRDAIVIACANWINSFEDFHWLTARLERTTLPVILVGIGAQSSLDMEMPDVADGTKRLLSIAAERSTSISARGEFTCDVLNKLGFKSAIPTGCPSLLQSGRSGPKINLNFDASNTSSCLHATRHGTQKPDPLNSYLYKYAFEKRVDLILQSEAIDIMACMSENVRHIYGDKDVEQILIDTYGASNFEEVLTYLNRHGRPFPNFTDWIAYMKTKSFCFGTRIHGTIASLVAGTAATLIAHDSRTLEMANSMGLPHITSDRIDIDKPLDIDSLLCKDSVQGMVEFYPQYLSKFEGFFEENGLQLNSLF